MGFSASAAAFMVQAVPDQNLACIAAVVYPISRRKIDVSQYRVPYFSRSHEVLLSLQLISGLRAGERIQDPFSS